ncbi:uncharacterized protein N7483_003213 [Penicillium malachiteum]|uniref:uncharacterized protein n=1 Tax=Penicillium malachiteum TaxID=1324776 RepID=UPI002546E0FB|nr:uncharacterized protein N7483_003213 [Penicillium malachiteum]KAJ5728705.1 hypothetical protein N7483_003213 [Penicillium malachiteum]
MKLPVDLSSQEFRPQNPLKTEASIGNADLKVEIAAPQGWTFAAGDSIIGTVTRRSPVVTPDATLRLILKGHLEVIDRNATSMGPDLSMGPHHHHMPSISSRAVDRQLWIPKTQVLFQGPLHLSEATDEPISWPFEFHIPDSPDIPTRDRETKKQMLPSEYEALVSGPLPGSFSCSGQSVRSSFFIEAYLEAELKYTHGGKPFTWKSIPRFDYRVYISAPQTIHLNDSAILPLKLRFSQPETPSKGKEYLPEVRLVTCKMSIVSKTMVYVDGSPANSPYDIERQTHELGLEKAFESTEAVPFPWSEKAEPVDIGNIFQLVLRSNGLKAEDTSLKRLRFPISPDSMCSIFYTPIHWRWIFQSLLGDKRIESFGWGQ